MRLTRIPITSIGVIQLDLPVVTLGRGRPIVSIITGLHGNEESGLLILRDLVRRLERRPAGTLRLFPSGNPLTQAFKQRTSPIDNVNPNRAFPGSDEGTVTSRTAATILRALRGSDLVIDLHCFGQDCVTTGILVDSGDATLVERERAVLRLLQPTCVWVERGATPDGLPITKNLGGYLNSVGVANIAIEMPKPDHLTGAARRALVQGLVRVVRRAGRISERTARRVHLSEFTREEVRAPRSGLFLPARKPLARITKGAILGQLIDPLTFRELPIRAVNGGVLMLITRPSLVRTGDKLYSVGRPVTSTRGPR